MRYIDVEWIQRSPWWPVKHRPVPSEAEVQAAADSLVLTPVIVRRLRDSMSLQPLYQIVENERSWAIAQAAGIYQVPAVIVDISRADAQRLVEAQYAALFPPDTLSPLEPSDQPDPVRVARTYAEALARIEREPPPRKPGAGRRRTISLVAREFDTSPALVRQHLNLLELPVGLQRDVSAGRIPFGAARLMHRLSGAAQQALARLIIERGYAVRDVEADPGASAGETPAEVVKRSDPDLRRLARRFGERTGAMVEIQPGKSGTGRLVIHYQGAEHLEGIMARPLVPSASTD
jgi:ParB family chromosome partitioning protein